MTGVNLKITRVGFGYDVHRLKEGEMLIFGGVEIPYEKGLLGWSDADVLTHAIADALLGSVALDDIGVHFPPGDPKYKDISSLILLHQVAKLLKAQNWQINNIDATIIAEKPKLSPFTDQMRENLSQSLNIEKNQVSVKATTTEGLSFAGREEGIAAYAVALVESQPPHE